MNTNLTVSKRTKIVATAGPASNTKELLLELMVAGVNVFRLNFSHGTHEQHLQVIKYIRELNDRFNFNASILQDLQGPKIRLGDIENRGIEVEKGEELIIAYEKNTVGTRQRLVSTFDLSKDVKQGEQILIDDGNIELITTKIIGNEVHTKVIYGGFIKPRKGINLPDTKITAHSLTDKDRIDLQFGLENEIDWIALSFVNTAVDVMELRQLIQEAGKDSRIVAKIERPHALRHIDEIIEVTDAIMVARGDLGVEIPMEEVPLVQKSLVQKCHKAAKPVIIATQMMESMIHNQRPTRAETNDVANAVMDGADALMLSAETASGKYPVQTVQSMVRTINHVEKNYNAIYNRYNKVKRERPDFISSRLLTHACKLAEDTEALALVALTKTGYTALQLASRRPKAQIIVFTRNRHILTMLNLVWGVKGYYYEKLGASMDEIFEEVERIMLENDDLAEGEVYVSTRSRVPDSERVTTNIIKIDMISRANKNVL